MHVFHELPVRPEPSVITLGTFDGIHIGHRKVIEQLVERARNLDVRAGLVTFYPHPLAVVDPARAPRQLQTREEKFRRLESLGLNDIYEVLFNREISLLSPGVFLEEMVLRSFAVQEAIIGYDHHFGRGRSGSARSLAELGERVGFTTEVIPPVRQGGGIVSSTRIRRAIAEGQVEEAAHLLEHPFTVSGVVDRGEGRGHSIGFPTANVTLAGEEATKIEPKVGVYAVRVRQPDGQNWPAMLNFGHRPTFGGDSLPRYEVHLFGFEGNLYGEHLTLDFIARLRDEERFDSIDALKDQLTLDRDRCRALLK